MKNRTIRTCFLVIVLALAAGMPVLAQAQEAGLRLRISKIFGYSGFGYGEIQGTMKLTARGPENLQRVIFLMDGQVMAEDTEAPFEIRFDTGSYALGAHTLTATGYTAEGQQLQSNPIQTTFTSAERGMQRGLSIVLPMLAIVFGVMLLFFVVPMLFSKGKKLDTPLGAERNYGVSGGAICPRCQRPFTLHAFAPNLGPWHKFERCPYCGKWGAMRRRSLKDLRAAEAAELQMAGGEPAPGLSAEQKLRKELEESRYHDI